MFEEIHHLNSPPHVPHICQQVHLIVRILHPCENQLYHLHTVRPLHMVHRFIQVRTHDTGGTGSPHEMKCPISNYR